jgi:uncharacterized membrane protein
MLAYTLDWLNFLGRWLHVITGIAWIGASFYFIWLDSNLRTPDDPEAIEKGIKGEVWSVHGGGIYHAQKYLASPEKLPQPLHWFKWEAYSTWLSGMFMLVLIYYVSADIYLIDQAIYPLTQGASIAIGLGFLFGGWIIYHALCNSRLGKNDTALAIAIAILCTVAAVVLCKLFSGRGAFIHYGAMLGTIMVANVAMVIIPGQREIVKAKNENRPIDPIHGLRGKQRSVHNTYFTLPVLMTMISNHYALFTNSSYNWLVLLALTVAGALIRLYFVFKNQGRIKAGLLWAGGAVLLALFFALAPSKLPPTAFSKSPANTLNTDVSGIPKNVAAIIAERCTVCHMAQPSYPGFAAPPKNILLDTPERIIAQAQIIYQQTVVLRAMPIGNLSNITEDERVVIARWAESLAAKK